MLGAFPLPLRGARPADTILAVYTALDRDSLLDRYLSIMKGQGHPCELLEVPPGDPFKARSAIRNDPRVRSRSIQGIQLFGKSIPSFRMRYFYPNSTLDSRGATDLPSWRIFLLPKMGYRSYPGFRMSWSLQPARLAIGCRRNHLRSAWLRLRFEMGASPQLRLNASWNGTSHAALSSPTRGQIHSIRTTKIPRLCWMFGRDCPAWGTLKFKLWMRP